METFRGIKIRYIFLDNNNWWNFYNKYKHLIRLSIVINVCKLLACGTAFLGFHQYTCQTCGNSKKVFHTCKSRFCSSCGKKATEAWIAKNLSILPNTPWQHITFTLPAEFRPLFWINRHLLNHIAKKPATIITGLAKKKNSFLESLWLSTPSDEILKPMYISTSQQHQVGSLLIIPNG